MPDLVVNAFIVYFLGLFLLPNLRADNRLRRWLEPAYSPLVRLGLWHRWSMFSPDPPAGTGLALAGVLLEDGTFEVVPLPGFDDDRGFGKARSLRFISFQLALLTKQTDYLEPALCDYAYRLWCDERGPAASGVRPVAVELRRYWYPSPAPGERRDPPEPEVSTLWSRAVEAGS